MDLRTYIEQELRLPEIDGERCVHSYIETASCNNCVDICPLEAWQLDDESLKIKVNSCDGCGLCAAVCPQGAILHSHEPLLRQYKQHIFAFAACEKSPVQEADNAAIMPCIHALSLHDVARLYQQQVRGLLISCADCENCNRFTKQNLFILVENFNQLLTSRELLPFILRNFTPENWSIELAKTATSQGKSLSRRDFLRRSVQSSVKATFKAKGWLTEKFAPPATWLPNTAEPLNYPYVPQIDTLVCTGCDACFNTCPQQALSIDLTQAQYVIKPELCTACNICVDICDQTAITIKNWLESQEIRFDLIASRCKRCGAPFHYPHNLHNPHNPQTKESDTKTVCPICQRVNHHKNLFQVYKD